MGNFRECQCKCKDNKQEGEVNLPTNKTNVKELQNGNNNEYNKNLKTLFKRNQNQITDDNENKNEKENNIFKDKDEYFDGISEIQLNDIDNINNNDNQKMSDKTSRKKRMQSNKEIINKNNSYSKKK